MNGHAVRASLLLVIAAACTSEGTVGVSAPSDAEVPPPGAESCASDDDCSDSDEPYCRQSVCHECTGDEHCAQGMEACDPWGECEALCAGDVDCEAPEHCDPSLQICLECRTDAECDEGQACDEGECEGQD